LISRATEKARDLGVDTLYLHTPDKSGFYSTLGWEKIEKTVYCSHEVIIIKKDPAQL
jgi:N-acetylglutamate synthase-like GNAT family acetyltransferase